MIFESTKNRTLILYLILCAVSGIFAIFALFSFGSESEQVFLFGLSKIRFAFLLLFIFLTLFLIGLSIFLIRSNRFCGKINSGINEFFVVKKRLVPTSFFLLLLLITEAILLFFIIKITPADYAVYSDTLSPNFSTLHVIGLRLFPLILWGSIISLLSLCFLFAANLQELKKREFWNFSELLKLLAGYLTICLTLIHWVILSFQFNLLQKIPGWYWDLRPKSFTSRDLLALIILFLVFLTVYLVIKEPQKVKRNLVLLFILGWGIQISFGFIEGQGFASIREKYFSSYHRFYAEWASQQDYSVGYVISHYEDLLGKSMFTSTKPPGVISIYVGLERLLNFIHPLENNAQNYLRLQNVITGVFPLLTFFIVFWLFLYIRRLHLFPQNILAAYLSPLIYILTPCIALNVLFLDQVLYPSLFLAGTFLLIQSIKQKKIWISFFTGSFLYLAVFISFSMIPLLIFGVIYAVLDYFSAPKRTFILSQLKLLFFILLGFLVLFLFFQYVFDYDIFQRYKNAMLVVYNFDHYLRVGASPESEVFLSTKIQHILSAAYLNNIEFALAVGIPVFVLFFTRSVKIIRNLVCFKFNAAENIQASFLGTFLALNAYGQMSGEAARLWMFWVPMVSVFAGIELDQLIKEKKWVLFLLFFLQFVTIFITFKFQDLQM